MTQPKCDRTSCRDAMSGLRRALLMSCLGALAACSTGPLVADWQTPVSEPDAQAARMPSAVEAGPRDLEREPQRRDAGPPSIPRAPVHDASLPPSGPGVLEVAIDALTPRLVSEEYEGPLCPRGSLAVEGGEGGGALTLRLAGRLDASEAPSTVRATCRVKLRLELPGGYTFASAHLYAYGHAGSSSGDANMSIRYGFAGSSESQSLRRSYDGPSQPFQLFGAFDRVWSPSCQGDGRVDVVLDLDASASGDARLSLHEVALGFSHVDGALWKRCADGMPARARASGKGAACAGLARQPCETGLECALRDAVQVSEPLLTGVCIDPTERASGRAEGQPCSVERGLACRADLVCHYASGARYIDGLLGVCTGRRGQRGDRCGGAPTLTCGAAMLCSAEAGSTCQPGDGRLGSPCQQGAVACASGLECRDAKCAHPLAGEDERCGGAEAIACRAPLVCDAALESCRRLERAPLEGERCDSAGPACGEGLICMHLRCQPEDTPYRGKPCATHDQCGARMRCTDSMVCWDERNGMEKAICDEDYPCAPGFACSHEGLCVPATQTSASDDELAPSRDDPGDPSPGEVERSDDGIRISVTRS